MNALKAGTRLGPYEIVAQIGAGGMGEVYRPATRGLGVMLQPKSSHRSSRPSACGGEFVAVD